MDTVHSSKTISATHSLLPNSVNSAFLQRSMCVGFLFFFFPVVGFIFVLFCFYLLLLLVTMFQIISRSFLEPEFRKGKKNKSPVLMTD